MNQNEPLLTIVIPVRNRQEIVGRTLRSIAAQTLRPLEVVLVDNASADSTPQILSKWAESISDSGIDVKILSETIPGASAARNCGLAAVATPFVMFFDSDDEMRPGHAERIDSYLRANPDCELVGFGAAMMDADGWTSPLRDSDGENLMRDHILHGIFATQRFAVSTELLRRVGGWDESLPGWNDLELGVRLLVASQSTALIHGDASVVIHPEADSISAPGYGARAAELEAAIEKIENTLRSADRIKEMRWARAKRMILGGLCRREGYKPAAKTVMQKALSAEPRRIERLKLRLAAMSVTLTGHGGAMIASLLKEPSAE
ncbi:MAG: glycosyltransferase family 2 protein [Paramuribaculum sp.]|nr:glycosyltransferase family 2 protein [Paramuribaculum sp.]